VPLLDMELANTVPRYPYAWLLGRETKVVLTMELWARQFVDGKS